MVRPEGRSRQTSLPLWQIAWMTHLLIGLVAVTAVGHVAAAIIWALVAH
jgi:hypothetical protein